MSVAIKSQREIELMREAGKILFEVHEELARMIKPGITTWDIDNRGRKLIEDALSSLDRELNPEIQVQSETLSPKTRQMMLGG